MAILVRDRRIPYDREVLATAHREVDVILHWSATLDPAGVLVIVGSQGPVPVYRDNFVMRGHRLRIVVTSARAFAQRSPETRHAYRSLRVGKFSEFYICTVVFDMHVRGAEVFRLSKTSGIIELFQ